MLKEFERKLEALFEGLFAKQFKTGVQPVELAKRLSREMDENRVVGVGRLYAPNEYIIRLSPEDEERVRPWGAALAAELEAFLAEKAERDGLVLLSRPKVSFVSTPDLTIGQFEIECTLRERAPTKDRAEEEVASSSRIDIRARKDEGTRLPEETAPAAYLMPEFKEGPLRLGARTTIGRSAGNDVSIPDTGVSRRHAEIIWTGRDFVLRDLGSTNGSYVNGHPVGERVLRDGDVISFGASNARFVRKDEGDVA